MAIKNGQSRETVSIGFGAQGEEKQNKNTMQYALGTTICKLTHNVNKTCALLKTIGTEPNRTEHRIYVTYKLIFLLSYD